MFVQSKGVFQFEVIISVLVSFIRFVWKHICYGPTAIVNSFSARIDIWCQILTSQSRSPRWQGKGQKTLTRAQARLGTRRGTDATIAWLSIHQRDDRRDVMQHMRRDGRRDDRCEETVTVLKKIAVPIAFVVALVCCADDEVHVVCLKNRRDVARSIASVCFTL